MHNSGWLSRNNCNEEFSHGAQELVETRIAQDVYSQCRHTKECRCKGTCVGTSQSLGSLCRPLRILVCQSLGSLCRPLRILVCTSVCAPASECTMPPVLLPIWQVLPWLENPFCR
jgi:uncharacterized protein with PIN domain